MNAERSLKRATFGSWCGHRKFLEHWSACVQFCCLVCRCPGVSRSAVAFRPAHLTRSHALALVPRSAAPSSHCIQLLCTHDVSQSLFVYYRHRHRARHLEAEAARAGLAEVRRATSVQWRWTDEEKLCGAHSCGHCPLPVRAFWCYRVFQNLINLIKFSEIV